MKYHWPNWWCKLELFRPDLAYLGDFIFTDLDNVIIGRMDELLTAEDFMLQWGGWTALMCVPEKMRHEVWDDFIKDPERNIEEFARENQPVLKNLGNYGDAGFISSRKLTHGTRYWEIAYPNKVVNIAYFRAPWPFRIQHSEKVLGDARIIMCGQPLRPWKLHDLKIKEAYWCQEPT
jgi:hypothetical protein